MWQVGRKHGQESRNEFFTILNAFPPIFLKGRNIEKNSSVGNFEKPLFKIFLNSSLMKYLKSHSFELRRAEVNLNIYAVWFMWCHLHINKHMTCIRFKNFPGIYL